MSNPPPVVVRGGAAGCRGGIGIGYRITGGQLQVTVGVACHTESRQALSTLVWAGRLGACSRRVLADGLRHAARSDPSSRLPVFAALARQLFRHAVHTLPLQPGNRRRRPHAVCPACYRPARALAAEGGIKTSPLPADLLAAVHALDSAARQQPRITLTDSAAIERLMRDTRCALHGLLSTLGSYLEDALQPHIRRDAFCAFILEMWRELDDLAACRAAGVYVEDMSVAERGDTSTRLEIEGSLDVAV